MQDGDTRQEQQVPEEANTPEYIAAQQRYDAHIEKLSFNARMRKPRPAIL
jgi:hypothetical protein